MLTVTVALLPGRRDPPAPSLDCHGDDQWATRTTGLSNVLLTMWNGTPSAGRAIIGQARLDRLSLSREEAARYVGVGSTTFDRLVEEGRMPRPLRLGKRVIWDRFKVDAAFSDLDEDRENSIDRALRLAATPDRPRRRPTPGAGPPGFRNGRTGRALVCANP